MPIQEIMTEPKDVVIEAKKYAFRHNIGQRPPQRLSVRSEFFKNGQTWEDLLNPMYRDREIDNIIYLRIGTDIPRFKVSKVDTEGDRAVVELRKLPARNEKRFKSHMDITFKELLKDTDLSRHHLDNILYQMLMNCFTVKELKEFLSERLDLIQDDISLMYLKVGEKAYRV